jgi:hypothetical protein
LAGKPCECEAELPCFRKAARRDKLTVLGLVRQLSRQVDAKFAFSLPVVGRAGVGGSETAA